MKLRSRSLFITGLLTVLLSASLNQVTAYGLDVQKETTSRQKQEIRLKFQEYLPMSRTFNYMGSSSIYEQAPSYGNPANPGKLKKEYILDGLKALNFVRYLAGLPSDVEPDWSLEKQEQAAAMVGALNDELSHYPTKPSEMDDALFALASKGAGTSNLYAGNPTLYSNVLGYMSDSDSSNIDRVGHRRWILNPEMKKTMFGFVHMKDGSYPYGAMYSFNEDRSPNEVKYDYVSWPSAGYFPAEMFAPKDAWSISLNPAKYNNTRTSSIEVTLTRTRDGKTWNFKSGDKDRSGKYFGVETSGYGIPYCIIFRPDQIDQFQENDRFKVQVDALYLKNGSKTSLSYETILFSLAPVPTLTSEKPLRMAPGERVALSYEEIGSLGALTPQFASSNTNVVEVDGNGNLTAKRSGNAVITVNQYFHGKKTIQINVVQKATSKK